jgi:glutathione S-transferase
VGDRLTLADISVVTGFANLSYAGCTVNGTAYPKLLAFVDKMLSRPSFARSLADEAKILAG